MMNNLVEMDARKKSARTFFFFFFHVILYLFSNSNRDFCYIWSCLSVVQPFRLLKKSSECIYGIIICKWLAGRVFFHPFLFSYLKMSRFDKLN